MLNFSKVMALSAALTVLSSNVFAEGMICSGEMFAGFIFDKASGEWNSSSGLSNSKYVLAKNKTEMKAVYEVRELGADYPAAYCEDEFNEMGILDCIGFGHDFSFSRKDLRFLMTYSIGYWNEKSIKSLSPERKQGDDNPHMIVGKCSEI